LHHLSAHMKLNSHKRIAVHAFGGNFFDTSDAIDRIFDSFTNLCFYFLGLVYL